MTDTPPLILLPAVDVAGGRAVRLVQADEGTAIEYGDPLAVARAWQRDGAQWLHLVDVDAAFGRGSNLEVLSAIVRGVDIAVQLSGGIRDDRSLRAALSTGCARVNLSTDALSDLAWVGAAVLEHGDRIAVGLDVRGDRLVARGSNTDVGELSTVLAQLSAAGCARYVVTDVSRDGSMTGPNLELLRRVCTLTNRPVVASGGVGSLGDVSALRGLVACGVEGAVLGQALYTDAIALPDALAVAGKG